MSKKKKLKEEIKKLKKELNYYKTYYSIHEEKSKDINRRWQKITNDLFDFDKRVIHANKNL